MGIDSQKAAAREVTEFLTRRDNRYGSAAKSVLEQHVESEIIGMTRRLAAEVVAAHPELAGVIRSRVQQVIAEALRTDNYLTGIVVKAVAAALTEEALARAHDAEEGPPGDS